MTIFSKRVIVIVNIFLSLYCTSLKDITLYSSKPQISAPFSEKDQFRGIPVGIYSISNANDAQKFIFIGLDNGFLQLIRILYNDKVDVIINKMFTSFQFGQSLLFSDKFQFIAFIKRDIVELLDITVPYSPVLRQALQIHGNGIAINIQLDFTQTRLFLLNSSGFDIYELSDDKDYQYLSSFSNNFQARTLNLFKNQTLAIIPASDQGIVLFSLENMNSTQYAQNDNKYPTVNPKFTEICQWIPDGSQNIIQTQVKDSKYLYALDGYQGIYVYSLINDVSIEASICSESLHNIQQIIFIQLLQITSTFLLIDSSQTQLLVLQSNSIISLYVNTDTPSYSQIQTIPIVSKKGITLSLGSNQDELLIYADSTSFYIHTKVATNYLPSSPNLLNVYQSFLPSNIDEQFNNNFIHTCESSDSQMIFTTGSNQSFIHSLSEQPSNFEQLLQFFPNPLNVSQTGQSLKYIKNKNTLAIGRKNSGIFFWNVTESMFGKIQFLSSCQDKHLFDPQSIEIFKSDTLLVVSSGLLGLSYLDISNITNPKYLQTLNYGIDGYAFSCAQVSSNGNFLFASIKQYGIISVNITTINEQTLISTVLTKGGQNLIFTFDQSFLISAEGYFGISIIKINDNYSLQLISSLILDPFVFKVKSSFSSKIIYALQRGEELLISIDISDKSNPITAQTLTYPNISDCFDICQSQNPNSSLILLTSSGILLINTNLSMNVHIDTYEKTSQKERLTNQNQYLFIGQQVEVDIIVSLQDTPLKLYSAFTIFNQQKVSIPSWVSLDINQNKIQFDSVSNPTIDIMNTKSLSVTSSQKVEEQRWELALIYFEQLTPLSFINAFRNITAPISKSIYQLCIQQGLITNQGYNSQLYELSSQIPIINNYIIDLNEIQIEYIRYILKQKQLVNPIQFTIVSTLLYINQPNTINNGILNQSDIVVEFFAQYESGYILTTSNQLYVELTLIGTKSIFTFIETQSVYVLISEHKQKMSLQGAKDDINKVLEKTIQLNSLDQNAYLQVLIKDNLNNPIRILDKLTVFPFISYQLPLRNNENYSCNKDFQLKYSEGIISILTEFIYEINKNCFVIPDKHNTLIFKVERVVDYAQNITEPLSTEFWLQFSSESNQIFGTPQSSDYGNTEIIRITISNGFTECFQDIKIRIEGIPFSYVISIIFITMVPILLIILLWRHKYILINALNSKQQMLYKPEIISTESQFVKIIPLIGQDLSQAKKIWKIIDQKLTKEFIKLHLKDFIHYQQDIFQCTKVLKESSQVQKISQLSQSSRSQDQLENIFTHPSQILNFDVKYRCNNQIQQKQQQVSFNPFSNLQIFESSASSIPEKNDLKVLRKQIARLLTLYYLKVSKLEEQQDQISSVESTFLSTETGGIDKFKFLSECSNILTAKEMVKKNKLDMKDINEKLLKKNSCLSEYICFKLSEKYISLHYPTKLLFTYLQRIGTEQYCSSEWYKAYAKIIPTIDNLQNTPFPMVQINIDVIDSHLNLIFLKILNVKKNVKNTQINQAVIDHSVILKGLITDQIIGYAYGFSQIQSSFYNYAIGESLNLDKQNIASIIALERKEKKPIIPYLSSILTPMSLYNNNKLPSWITSIEITQNVIILQGCPSNKDFGEVFIQIIDKHKVVVKQFSILIEIDEKKPKLPTQIQNILSMQPTNEFPSILSFNQLEIKQPTQSMNAISPFSSERQNLKDQAQYTKDLKQQQKQEFAEQYNEKSKKDRGDDIISSFSKESTFILNNSYFPHIESSENQLNQQKKISLLEQQQFDLEYSIVRNKSLSQNIQNASESYQ